MACPWARHLFYIASVYPASKWLPSINNAVLRACVLYRLPAALEYPSGYWNGFCVYRPAREGRLCEHFGGYKAINRIPLPLKLRFYSRKRNIAFHLSNYISGVTWWNHTCHVRQTQSDFHLPFHFEFFFLSQALHVEPYYWANSRKKMGWSWSKFPFCQLQLWKSCEWTRVL